MALVAPINLPYNVRTLWFDPNGLDICAGDHVVVQTVRGLELGVAASDITEVDEESIKKLKSPLKPVVRIATAEDMDKAEEMERLGREAMPIFKEMARETSEDMHPVSVEYLLDGDKAIFYFEAEERIDFRELVRKLASHFHIRIDMHQIGVRDEARIVGGIAHCGQEVCCKRMGGEFKPVSIRMAKDQDLSLNPQKISGLCGRLMCCLRYENEAYTDFKSRAPKLGAKIKTPEGDVKVTNLDVPKETITVQPEEGKAVKVPLKDFKSAKDGKRPDTITKEGWEIANREEEIAFESSTIFSTSNFTGTDKLGSAKAIHHPTRDASEKRDNSPKRRGERAKASQNQASDASHRKQRKRRSTVIKAAQSTQSDKTQSSSGTQKKIGNESSKESGASKLRPGHRSSGLSSAGKKSGGSKSQRRQTSSKQGQNRASDDKSQRKSSEVKRQQNQTGSNTNPHRRRRRRRDSTKSENDKGTK